MDRIRIRGGHPLKGEIPISGAKNAALKLMAASLLTADPLILANVPRLADVRAMAELLMTFGITIQVNMSPNLGEGEHTIVATGQGANGAVYQRISESVYHDIRSHTDALFERSYPIFH